MEKSATWKKYLLTKLRLKRKTNRSLGSKNSILSMGENPQWKLD